jgi:glycosyltransferase involved in cell wall biosynthesis
VLLVGDYPPPYGGLSVQVASLAHQLAARGDTDVQVLDIGARRRETRPGCLPARGALGLATTVVSHARRGFRPHLHTNGHNRKSWLVALGCTAAAAIGGQRAVVSLGSGLMPAFLERARPAVRGLARTALAAADAVIVRNERARTALTTLGVAPAKLFVLPGFYGVAADEIGEVPEEIAGWRTRYRPLIGAIATRGPEYGLSLLIDAAARLRPAHPRLGVVLLGPDRLEDGCPGWALPAGECERPALLAAMQQLDVFVRPTYFDGDASSVREALALGVRVVASDTDFRPDVVRRFPCGDADALAAAIEAALAGPATRCESTSLPALLALYDALGAAGRRAAAQCDPDGVRVG